MDAAKISRSGLDVEWQRLQIIAQNLANENTSRTTSGAPFRPMRLISGPKVSFDQAVAGQGTGKNGAHHPVEVGVLGMEAEANGTRHVYEPGNPQAGSDGFVSYPALDHAGEMTLLIKTSRVYEANLTALTIAGQMYTRALDLGRQS